MNVFDHGRMLAAALLLAACAAAPDASSPPDLAGPNVARGVVYLDANRNGVRDAGERGVASVRVSNGVDVVRTDAQGRYAIGLELQSILFISKPSGYDVPVNEVQLPQFYYMHYPDGPPDVANWQWPVVEPTGPLPAAIDFALLPGSTGNKFDAMAFADPQTANDEHLDMMRKDIIEPLFANPYNAAFGMVAGDVVNDVLSLYDRHNSLMSQIGIPIWNVPGNHDINFEAPDNEFATMTYRSVFGPDYYSFDYGLVHFLALNNVEWRGTGNGYRGWISDKQLAWIENDLKDVPDDRLIVIITHIPLLTHAQEGGGVRYGEGLITGNLSELVKRLARFRHVYGIAGHDTSNSWKAEVGHDHGWHGYPFISHTLAEVRGSGWQRGPRDEQGVRPAMMADGNPNGYYVFHFDGVKIAPRFIPAGSTWDDRLRVTLDPRPGNGTTKLDRGPLAPGTKLVVNLFDGGERDTVWVSFNGAAKIEMTNVERTDPLIVAEYERYRGTPDAFAAPAPSSHIWEIELPAMGPGLHVAEVTALDQFGFDARKVFTFEVE